MKTRCVASVVAACVACGSAAATELVINGGFETGDLTGWSLFGLHGFPSVSSGFFNGENIERSGAYGLLIGPPDFPGGGIEQIISASIGDVVTVSFWLHTDGSLPNSFRAELGGTALMTASNQATTQLYTQFTFSNIVVTNNNPLLSFGFYHASGFYYLDDVSVQLVSSAIPLPSGAALATAGLVLVATRRRR